MASPSLPVPRRGSDLVDQADPSLDVAEDLRERTARERATAQALKDYLLTHGQAAGDVADGALAWTVAHAEGDRAVVTISGELDHVVGERFRQALGDLAEAGTLHLDLDLEAVTFLDSRGLSVLLQARRRVVRQGGSLRVVALSPQVRRVLRITGLHHLLLDGDLPG